MLLSVLYQFLVLCTLVRVLHICIPLQEALSDLCSYVRKKEPVRLPTLLTVTVIKSKLLPLYLLHFLCTGLLSQLPTVTTANCHNCQLSKWPTVTTANCHNCQLSQLPTVTTANCHNCQLSNCHIC
jgi:hypothetical protein